MEDLDVIDLDEDEDLALEDIHVLASDDDIAE